MSDPIIGWLLGLFIIMVAVNHLNLRAKRLHSSENDRGCAIQNSQSIRSGFVNGARSVLRHVRILDLRSGSNVRHREHDRMDLANRAIESFRNPIWSEKQCRALDAFFLWQRNWQGPSAGEQPVRELLEILRNIFFKGELRTVTFSWNNNYVRDKGLYGRTEANEHQPYTANITLDPNDWSREKGVGTHHEALLSTLLHECVHAYLRLYSCWDCPSCSTARGPKGHGRAWSCLAANVEAVARGLLRLDVRLGAFGYAHENVLTARDWEQYYQNTFYGSIDYSWPFLPNSRRTLNNMVQLSMDRDSRVRRVLRKAAQRHGQHAVVFYLDNEQNQGAMAKKWRVPCW
ncbi:hypothetical protein LTR10_008810 [Elasticomyces elasticus]|nr:hypothetical protein LTR10_008810 [Elasticomyces elasticus]KAK4974219.1 hypothetical protein LTR42_004858 [Elasticomyces elasticus]